MLERAVEQSIDGIAESSLEGTIRFVNHAWVEWNGYKTIEPLGKNLSIFHTKDQMQREGFHLWNGSSKKGPIKER